MIKKFNDLFAIMLTSLIVALWVVAGTNLIEIPPEVLGSTIAVFTLVAQFYFRKSPPGQNS